MKQSIQDYLLAEYEKHRQTPLTVRINNEKLIIPYEYAAAGGTSAAIQKRFFYDYFDRQKDEYDQYKTHNIRPRLIEHGGMRFVVPFRLRHSKISDTAVVEGIFRRARAKYEKAVNLTRKLAAAFPERDYTVEIAGAHVSDMQTFYRNHLINKFADESRAALIRAGEFVAAGARSLSRRSLPISPAALSRSLKRALVGTAIVGVTAAGVTKLSQTSSEKTLAKTPELEQAIDKETAELQAETAEFSAEIAKVAADSKIAAKPLAAKPFKRSEIAKNALFKTFMRDIFASEGGYGDKNIDQPTNMGIIQPTLDGFVKNHPRDAKAHKFPAVVKKLTRAQAELIYKYNYFDQYKIGDYRNKSIGLLIFDIYVNHEPKTAKQFIDQALKAVKKAGAKDLKLPTSTPERVSIVNMLAASPEYEKIFYKGLMKERKYHMYKKTTLRVKKGEIKKTRFAAGLRNRAAKYEKRFIPTLRQERGESLQAQKSR